jgi:hypothetical protein
MADTTAPQQPPVPSLEDRQAAMNRERDAARQSRRASAVAKINAARTAEVTPVEAPAVTEAPKAVTEAKPPAPVEAKQPDPPKPAEAPAADDEATKRGLLQIEHARKRFQEEQASVKAELEVQRAEIARLRQEAQGKVSSIEELKKLDLSALLDKLGYDDAALTRLSRESYYRTAEGQKNPAAKQAVDEVRTRTTISAVEEQMAELRKELAEAKEAAKAAKEMIFQREYANEWLDGALKEVPADKPTFISKLTAKNPRGARAALLAIGGELEQAHGAAPTAAEVIAEYEKRQRDYLESQGFDVESLLTPPAPKPAPAPAPAPKPARTLEVGATQITRPETVPQTREERRANALAKLRMQQRQTADRVS